MVHSVFDHARQNKRVRAFCMNADFLVAVGVMVWNPPPSCEKKLIADHSGTGVIPRHAVTTPAVINTSVYTHRRLEIHIGDCTSQCSCIKKDQLFPRDKLNTTWHGTQKFLKITFRVRRQREALSAVFLRIETGLQRYIQGPGKGKRSAREWVSRGMGLSEKEKALLLPRYQVLLCSRCSDENYPFSLLP